MVSLTEFQATKQKIHFQLEKALQSLVEQSALEAPQPSDALANLCPNVDSKSIAQLAGIFEELIGTELSVDWIQPGGYPDAPTAITDILKKYELHIVEQQNG